MSKRVKTVSMVMALMATSWGGVVNAGTTSVPDVNKQTQSDAECKGVVKDATGEPVIGASVLLKGKAGVGTVTDIDGNFVLKNVKKGDVLQISSFGMVPVEVVYNGSALSVTLKEDAKALDEVVVTALGMKREKKALGYAVTELKGSELNANLINPVQALQGKVAGVEITSSDGGMFGASKILIRGASTLNKNNQPIYVVDGVILDNDIVENDADWASGAQNYGNELKNLNPDDFESVSILKVLPLPHCTVLAV